MRYAFLLALIGASTAHAQIGSRGAVEVVREGDNVPTPPPEAEPADAVVAIEDVPEEEPAVEPEPAPVAPERVEVQRTHQAAEIPPGDAEPQPREPRELREPREPTTIVERVEQPAPEPTTVVVAREADPLVNELQEFVSIFGRDGSGNLWGILLWFILAAVAATGIRRVRESFPSDGLIPNALALLHVGMRLVVIALALAFIVRALPPRLSLVMLLAFAGLAVAIGWSLRDVMPDLVASLVIAFERRIRRGVWVSGEGFAGHVERLGLRAALLYDTHGNRVMVPNREIVRAPVTAGVGDHARELEVEVRIAGPAEEVRAALRDAVLTSPWVHPDAKPVVLRDPADPERWRVRGRLLEASFGARFEGELLERAEALLGRSA